MNIKNFIYVLAAFAAISILHSCKPDKNNCDNCETELITTLNVQLTDLATGAVSNFLFRDLDGDGSNAPVQFDTIQLLANHTYNVELILLDESKTPADTISHEIEEEADEHQFFFHAHGISVAFTYEDFDSHTPPLPVGLKTKWSVGNTTGNGEIHIILKHQPDSKDGNEATGETDLDVEFNARVQ